MCGVSIPGTSIAQQPRWQVKPNQNMNVFFLLLGRCSLSLSAVPHISPLVSAFDPETSGPAVFGCAKVSIKTGPSQLSLAVRSREHHLVRFTACDQVALLAQHAPELSLHGLTDGKPVPTQRGTKTCEATMVW